MRVSRNLSAWVIAGLLLAALAGLAEGEGGPGGQEVSEHGNPWVRVSRREASRCRPKRCGPRNGFTWA